ncbi:MAG: hypothetical protein IIT77_00005, partial [Oscillospiraceae bacterium]|nr:hypothetical protein [Oscillospiraceae bacterium]
MTDKKSYKSTSFISFAVILLIWFTATKVFSVNKVFLPSPGNVAEALKRLLKDGMLLRYTWMSTKRVFIGWLIS